VFEYESEAPQIVLQVMRRHSSRDTCYVHVIGDEGSQAQAGN